MQHAYIDWMVCVRLSALECLFFVNALVAMRTNMDGKHKLGKLFAIYTHIHIHAHAHNLFRCTTTMRKTNAKQKNPLELFFSLKFFLRPYSFHIIIGFQNCTSSCCECVQKDGILNRIKLNDFSYKLAQLFAQ